MLGLANAFAKRARPKLAPGYAWGVGILDQPLATAWYPSTWDDISDDELDFLIPSLSRSQPGSLAGQGAAPVPDDCLTRVLCERAEAVACLMAEKSAVRHPAAHEQLLVNLIAQGSLLSLPQDAPRARYRQNRQSRDPVESQPRGDKSDWLRPTLISLAYADRSLSDAAGNLACVGGGRTPLVDWPLSLSDALIISASTHLNAAYLYPEFSHAHDVLTLAAALGHLGDSRAVNLSLQLAAVALDSLATRKTGNCETVMVLHALAEQALGTIQLTAVARVICALSIAIIVTPDNTRVSPSSVKRVASDCWSASMLASSCQYHEP